MEWAGTHGSVTWRWGWARIGSDRRGVVLRVGLGCVERNAAPVVESGFGLRTDREEERDGDCRCVLGTGPRSAHSNLYCRVQIQTTNRRNIDIFYFFCEKMVYFTNIRSRILVNFDFYYCYFDH